MNTNTLVVLVWCRTTSSVVMTTVKRMMSWLPVMWVCSHDIQLNDPYFRLWPGVVAVMTTVHWTVPTSWCVVMTTVNGRIPTSWCVVMTTVNRINPTSWCVALLSWPRSTEGFLLPGVLYCCHDHGQPKDSNFLVCCTVVMTTVSRIMLVSLPVELIAVHVVP